MKKFNSLVKKNIGKILFLFIIMQPLLDVIAAFMLNLLKISFTFSSIIRFLFLIFCIYYLLFINRKQKNILYISLFAIYIFIFSLIILFNKDISVLFYELKNAFNVFYFPIVFLTLLNISEEYKFNYSIKNIVSMYLIYCLLILIPNLTNSSFMSYSQYKVGNVGWFVSANSVGNIFSILFPFILYYVLTIKKKYFIRLFLIFSSCFIFLTIGTKTPLFSFLICILITFIYYFILWIKNRMYKFIFISSLVLLFFIFFSIIIIPRTSFYKNIQIHKDYLCIDNYFDVFKDYRLIDHFIFSQRLTFLSNTSSYYSNADIFQKFFGVGYIENYGTDVVSTKMIEMDYFDILFRNGFVGFCLFFSVLSIKKDKQINNKLLNLETNISVVLILLLAFFTGHILTSPSVSIFVSLILISFYQGGFYEEDYKR